MNGLSPEEHVGRPFDHVLPLLAVQLEPLFHQVLHSGSPLLNREIRGETPARPGVIRRWVASLFPILQEGRVNGIGSIVTEITGDRGEAHPENAAVLRAMVGHSPGLVALFNAEGAVLSAGPSERGFLGYTPDDFVGRHALERIHPEDFEAFCDFLTDLKDIPGRELTLRYRTKHTDGSWRWVEAYGINAVEDPKVGGVLTYYRDITDRKIWEERLVHQAFHDPLTRLPNRIHFIHRLEESLARDDGSTGFLAVMFIDLDGFKTVNDTLGHSVGDELLVEVSRRLLMSLRSEDTLSRMGGDEFTILLEEVQRVDEAVEVAKRILAELSRPFILSEREVFVSASIGIALALPGAAQSADLLRKADTALYEAKRKGKADYEIYDLSMNERAWRRLELETDLRRALERDELRVYYQPVIDLQSGLVRELEALVRWEHPRRGMLLPLEFIPLAEESGHILDLDFRVLRTAAGEVRTIQDQFPELSPLSLNVNFSALHFRQEQLVERITRTLGEAGLSPEALKIEITENILRENPEDVLQKLSDMRDAGIRLSIDDIGIGPTALDTLKRYPMDVLKIDRSFTRELHPAPQRHGVSEEDLLQNLFSFGKALGMSMTGEGIESMDQLDQLRKLGCKLGQGYLFARPQPIEQIRRLFERSASGEAIPLGGA